VALETSGRFQTSSDHILIVMMGKQTADITRSYQIPIFIANRTFNMTVTGSCCIRYYQIQSDPVA